MRLVLKFGGTSVGDLERIQNAAQKVAAEVKAGHQVAVVVSAMSGVTNQLVGYCQQLAPGDTGREYDAVVASGEQVTSGLMALALQKIGVKARSYQGWQMGLRTDGAHGKARIEGIDGERLRTEMDAGTVPVVAGFQGVTQDGSVTTLGRGGSDTSAVALAAALDADRCDIYTDVDGVYTTDPRICDKAVKLKRLAYEEMLELASLGAKVLQTRSVEVAMRYKVPLQVLSTFAPELGSSLPGTLLLDEERKMEKEPVTGIAYSRDEAQVTLRNVADKPGVAAKVFVPLGGANINVDMIVQNVSADGKAADITFTVPKSDLKKAEAALNAAQGEIGFTKLDVNPAVAKVSVVGVGMRSHAGVAATMFATLASSGVNIRAISTSEIKISVLIDEASTETAVRALHHAYGLDGI